MIISASRRTDIPTYYSDWFFNRLKAGFVYVRNPMNIHQVSSIKLDPDVVDGIVFWTKNPVPMIDRLELLRDYAYYFQFTITPYGRDVEPNIPSKEDVIIPAFKRLSDMLGANRVIWRYDPIFLSEKYTIEYHLKAFEHMAKQLQGYTEKSTVSFLDLYRKTPKNIKDLNVTAFSEADMLSLGQQLAEIAHSYGLALDTCAEKIDLSQYGVKHAHCIDARLFERLLGCAFKVGKDPTQRQECGCVASVDIGMYNTCRNGCKYCYANFSEATVNANYCLHDPASPLLFGNLGPEDKITERKIKSCLDGQMNLLDML